MIDRKLAALVAACVDRDADTVVEMCDALSDAAREGKFPNIDKALALFRADDTAVEEPDSDEDGDELRELDFAETG